MTTSGQLKAPAAIAFETGLVVLAAVLGWLLGRWPLPGVSLAADSWHEQWSAVGWGTLAAVPLILGLLLLDRFPCGPWGELQQTVERRLLPWIRHWSILDMALISLAAGFGEEMLFRGLLQAGLADLLPGPGGMVLALVVASGVFGICHWITTSYAVLAGVMGLYLGALLLITENLLAPITTHAVYDFVALIYLTRFRPEPEHPRPCQDP
jgi:uncharacterized protein